jgi:hypothetical protein
MPNPLRFIPEEAKLWEDSQGRPIAIVEITIRCLQGRFLLVPRPAHVRILLGVLGRAQDEIGFELYGYGYLSNHGSIIVGVRDVNHLKEIMEYVHGNIARELGRREYSNWPGKFWSRRGRPILILSDEDLEARMRYLLSNSTKEDLETHPTKWRGAHCARALCSGRPDIGLWIDRTGLYRARQRKGRVLVSDFEKEYSVWLSKLPSRAELNEEQYRAYSKSVCDDVAAEATAARGPGNEYKVLGSKAAARMNPHHRPDHVERSPAPLVHCRDKSMWKAFLKAYKAFCAQYRSASESLWAGIDQFYYPPGGIYPGCRPAVVIDSG